MSENETNSPKVYSYGRFSTPEQALGDSERRQIDNAKAYAKRIGVEFDEKLSLFDRGASGYKGHNLKAGSALGGFLEKVELGAVSEGSVLVVENVDRITRLDYLAACEIINGILRAGIKIHTLSPEQTYDRDISKNGSVYMLVAQITLAHAESEKKSERLLAVWEEKRKIALTGKIISKRAKGWLVDVNDRWKIREGGKETLTQMFEYKKAGFSVGAITRKLNEAAAWIPTQSAKRKNHGWNSSYVQRILSDRAVIGEFRMYRKLHSGKRLQVGEPIMNVYYPPVVDRGLFEEVQKILADCKERNVNGGGAAADKGSNLFSEIVRCGYCGGSMHRRNHGLNREDKRGKEYLVCYNGERAAKHPDTGERLCAKAHRIAYADFERLVLAECRRLKPEQILPNENDREQELAQAKMRVAELSGRLEDNERAKKKIRKYIEGSDDEDKEQDEEEFRPRLRELRSKKAELEVQLKESESILQGLQVGLKQFEERQKDLKSLMELIQSDDEAERIEARLKLRAHLSTIIERVEVFAEGTDEEREERLDMFSALIDECSQSEAEGGGKFVDISLVAPNYLQFMKYARIRLGREAEVKKTCFYRIFYRKRLKSKTSELAENGKNKDLRLNGLRLPRSKTGLEYASLTFRPSLYSTGWIDKRMKRSACGLIQLERPLHQFQRFLEDFTDLRKAPLWEPKPQAVALLEPQKT